VTSTPTSSALVDPARVRHDVPWPARARHGMTRLTAGLALLRRTPSLRRWALVPMLLSALFVLAALVLAAILGDDLVAAVLPEVPAITGWTTRLLGWGHTLAGILLRVALAAVLLIGAFVGAGVLASPAYDRLSAATERLVRGADEGPSDLAMIVGDVAQGVAHSVLGLALWAGLGCMLLPLGLVPLLGPPTEAVLWVGTSSLLLAREALDFAWSRRRLSFADKLRVLWRERAVTSGLGVGCFVLMLVPGANLVVLPVAVVGATLLALELEEADLSPRRGQQPAHRR
jgi:CysZ protein